MNAMVLAPTVNGPVRRTLLTVRTPHETRMFHQWCRTAQRCLQTLLTFRRPFLERTRRSDVLVSRLMVRSPTNGLISKRNDLSKHYQKLTTIFIFSLSALRAAHRAIDIQVTTEDIGTRSPRNAKRYRKEFAACVKCLTQAQRSSIGAS
jgi:hypothetical protein